VFELYKKNAKCVDKDDKLYEYGQFNNVKVRIAMLLVQSFCLDCE